MANETIVKIRILDRNKTAQPYRPVMLMDPDTDAHPFNPQPTKVLFSGNTDGNGYVEFDSVVEGKYDIKIVNASGNSIFSYGHIVKNSYIVDPVNPAESRFSVRSGEHIQGVGAGIIARTADAIGGMYSSYSWGRYPVSGNGVIVGAGLLNTATGNVFQNPIDGTLFMIPATVGGKLSGNSYYHDNQNLSLSQNIDIMIS